MLPVKAPRDPAPSRIKYRLERLWLRPTIRKFVRTGLPLVVAVAAYGSLAADPGVRAALRAEIGAMRERIAAHPGLMLQELRVTGAGAEVERRIAGVLSLDLPVSSMNLDLAALHAKVAALDAVRTASVRVETGGILLVEVTEREPVILWRSAEGVRLLDITGAAVDTVASRLDHPGLPLVSGAGAPAHVAEALELFAAAEPVIGRVRGLVRVGERRWDVALDRDQTIRLPEDGAVNAMRRVMALHAAYDILERDVTVVDFRDGRRPTLRLSGAAMEELNRRRSGAEGEET